MCLLQCVAATHGAGGAVRAQLLLLLHRERADGQQPCALPALLRAAWRRLMLWTCEQTVSLRGCRLL